MESQGLDTTSLQDERSRLIDNISSIVPVTAVKRGNGAVAIYSQNGGALLDGKVYELSFTAASNVVTPDLTVGAGLSGLSQDQGALTGPTAVGAGTGKGLFDGGSLGALFEVRDTIVPGVRRRDRPLRHRPRRPLPEPDAGHVPRRLGRRPLRRRRHRHRRRRADRGQRRRRPRRRRRGLAPPRRPLGRARSGTEGDGTILQALADAMGASRTPTGFVSQSAANDSATMASEIASYFAGKSARSDEDLAYLTRAPVDADRRGDQRGRRRQRLRAPGAHARRAGLCRQRQGAVGDRRPHEASAGELTCA